MKGKKIQRFFVMCMIFVKKRSKKQNNEAMSGQKNRGYKKNNKGHKRLTQLMDKKIIIAIGWMLSVVADVFVSWYIFSVLNRPLATIITICYTIFLIVVGVFFTKKIKKEI